MENACSVFANMLLEQGVYFKNRDFSRVFLKRGETNPHASLLSTHRSRKDGTAAFIATRFRDDLTAGCLAGWGAGRR
jgi:hypothetical protein